MPEQLKMPSPKPRAFLSYAWRDESSPETEITKHSVDALKSQVLNQNWGVVPDRMDKPYGDMISRFMNPLGAADIMIVVLSDRYLRSVPCMTELHRLWWKSVTDGETFFRRILVVSFPDAKPENRKYCLDIDSYWVERYEDMRGTVAVLNPVEKEVYGQIEAWYKDVVKILTWLRTFLQPLAFAEISKEEFRAFKGVLEKKRQDLATESEQERLNRQVIAGLIETRTPDFRSYKGDRDELAIVFTDVVDSTALGQKLGDDVMEAVRRAHFAESRAFIEQFQGREVKAVGDSFMVAFHSADSAFGYAQELQRDPGDPQLQVRAGIHFGKISVDESDIFGGTVNFAARVVSAAKREPEIWVSDAAKIMLSESHQGLPWRRHDGVTIKGFAGTYTLWSLPPAT